MDITEYISSGILERYVLGNVSEQELKEVECMSHIYPEIQQEVRLMQDGIERMALKLAKPPSVALKKKVLEEIKKTPQISTHKKETPVVSLEPKKSNGIARLSIAASILIIVGLGVWNYSLRNQTINAENQLAETTSLLEETNENLDRLANDYSTISDQMAFINDPNTAKINLAGTDNHPKDQALVYWNPTTEKVFLETAGLAANNTDQSYQLWVLIDGTPKSMGVFEKENQEQQTTFLEMKLTNEADAFAITAEPFGGSENPTLENLHVIGVI